MNLPADLNEYLAEIRKEVCSRCVERPPGGPPCSPLGKFCGVEMHLPELVQSIHAVQSPQITPYLDHNRETICQQCAFLHSSICPCPMDYLSVLVVQAVEAVDERRREAEEVPIPEPPEVHEILRMYEEARGTWTGCDWKTAMGENRLDLEKWTAMAALARSREDMPPALKADWQRAAAWLEQVEHHAREAEKEAAAAVAAAQDGDWRNAYFHIERAWALEFSTGRPLWHHSPQAWLNLHQAIETAFLAREFNAVAS